MKKFDPDILEEIRVVLYSSRDLLEIEKWTSFDLDCSTPIKRKGEIFLAIKDNISEHKNVSGIYAIFDGETCLYIGKGKKIWERIKSHYKAAKGVDGTAKWDVFFNNTRRN